MTAATEIRRQHRNIITAAELRASEHVAQGVEDLREQIARAEWPWERQVLEGHLRRIEGIER